MFLKNLNQYSVILASQSPRRYELLKGIGINFSVMNNHDIKEEYPSTLKTNEIATYLSELKANFYLKIIPENGLLITADTIVVLNEKILLKPIDYNDAIEILTVISGNMHKVITGVCVWTKNKKITFSDSSDVYFRDLTNDEIKFYINEYKPYDKAGAYGVQEWIGYIGIRKVVGSYFNVMGLPIDMLYDVLKQF